MDAPGAPQGAPGSQGGAGKLLADIHDQMSQLMSAMGQSEQMDPADKEQLASIIDQFQSFAQNLAGAPQAPAPMKGNLPMEAGTADVRPAL